VNPNSNRRTSTPRYLRRILSGGALLALIAGLAGCGTTAAAPANNPTIAPASGDQMITLSEWKVAVQSSIKAGQVSFKIVNGGGIEHELLVFKADKAIAGYPVDDAGAIKEEDASIAKTSDGDNIAVGNSQTRTIDLSTPGRYLFTCNIPTHFKQGMATIVTVT
jgi:uncharacterized cupredoxin-like copper-binding protein